MLELIDVLTVVAAALALYFKFRYARGLKRLQRELDKQKPAEPLSRTTADVDGDAG